MRIESMLLAEGATQDARGAWTVVGLNQDVFATRNLPAHTKRAVVTRVTGVRDHQQLNLRYAVVSPTGRVLVTQENDVELGTPPIAALPASLDFPAEFVLSVTEFGEHRIEFEVTDRAANETVLGYVSLHVVDARTLVPDGVLGNR